MSVPGPVRSSPSSARRTGAATSGALRWGNSRGALAHLREAARRHAHLADVVIALAVFTATVVTAFAGRFAADEGHRTTAIAAAALGCGVLAVRRRRPLLALTVSAVAAEVFLAWSGGSSGVLILLAPLLALYTVADLVERRPALLMGCGAVAALALLHAVQKPALLGPQNLAFIALGGLAIAAGDSSRNRRAYLAEVERRAERAEREREQDARRRVAEERLRIARDLHDAVGHQLALISVQSNVAGQALDRDVARAREALAHVKDASRRALVELRDTVSLLRQPGDPVAPTSIPAPGLDGLDELLASLRDSGLVIDRRTNGTAAPLAPAADLTAYRVIQESLTNVYKHSARREARLTLSYDRDELRITVEDSGGVSDTGGAGTPDGPRQGSGSGLSGGPRLGPGSGSSEALGLGSVSGSSDGPRQGSCSGSPDGPRQGSGSAQAEGPRLGPGSDPSDGPPRRLGSGPSGGHEIASRSALAADPGPADGHEPPSVSAPTGRHGILGMRERVLALGGRFAAGPRADGAFQVTASLPYQPLDLARESAP